MVLGLFPDSFKGMLKGVLKSMNLHKNAMLFNLTGHLFVNFPLIWYLGFRVGMGESGLLAANCFFQIYVMLMYLTYITR